MRHAAAAWAAFALVGLAPAALAQRAAPLSVLVRIDGYVGAKPPKTNLLVSWRVNRGRDVYDLHVTQLLVLTGTVRPADIIDGLRPFSPALSLTGNPTVLETFVAAPAHQKLAITGYLRIEPPVRELVLSQVGPISVPSPAADLQ